MDLSTANWHLPRALPVTDQQGCLPSASMEMESHAIDHQHPLGSAGLSEALCAPGNLVGQVFRQLDVFRSRCYDLSPCISSYLEKH